MVLEYGTFDVSECDDELLAKQCILQQQLGPRASNIGNETEGNEIKQICDFRFQIVRAHGLMCDCGSTICNPKAAI